MRPETRSSATDDRPCGRRGNAGRFPEESAMNPTLHAMRLLAWFALGVLLAAAVATKAFAAAPPAPPQQPRHGPGGADYAYDGVVAEAVKDGAEGWWLFKPSTPISKSVPVIVFCHGWGA